MYIQVGPRTYCLNLLTPQTHLPHAYILLGLFNSLSQYLSAPLLQRLSQFKSIRSNFPHAMTELHGICDPAFESLRDLLQQRIAKGNEAGASLCINIAGKNVVDLWGGSGSPGQPWDKDTITGVWSLTKIVTAVAALILVNRGLLDINENVAAYWPEFAANGKESIKVSQILGHCSGVVAIDRELTPEELLPENREAMVTRLAEELQDDERIAAKFAEQPTWYNPASQSAYKASSYGHLVGELIRRITGKSLAQFISEEITTPLGADFQLGVSEKDLPRTADTVPFTEPVLPLAALPATSVLGRVLRASLVYPTAPNLPIIRKSENGAMGGFSNARAMARIGSVISLDGTVDGKQYLTPETVDEMTREQTKGFDLCTNGNMRFALGLGLPWSESLTPIIPEEEGVSFWCGYGGAMTIMDRRRRMTISYVMNKLELRGRNSNSNFDLYYPEIRKGFEKFSASV